MPRTKRIVVPGCWHHVTHRGNHRQQIFQNDEDRAEYLDIVRHYSAKYTVRMTAFCLMSNHVHWIAIPETEDGLSKLFGRAHHLYALRYQARRSMAGHLWQCRFYSCPLSQSHLTRAIRYIEQNPVRAGLVSQALDWRWSSAYAHVCGKDPLRMVEMDWWAREGRRFDWPVLLNQVDDAETADRLKRCTATGRPFGDEEFATKLAASAGVTPEPRMKGRPRKTAQKKCLSLFQGVVGAGEVEQGGARFDADRENFAQQNRVVAGWVPLDGAAVKVGQCAVEPW
jgi:putative transposase